LGTKTYGDLPFAVSATVSSGLPASFAIVSGPATLTGSTVTITGAGTVVIRADQSGNANWNAAVPVQQSFVVAKATITVAADAKTRVFGAANPTLTASYAGFVNGDSLTVMTGTPALSTTATGLSSVSGSPYPISAAQGTLSAANYNFAFVNGLLDITPASSSTTLTSSANPIPTGSNVTFVATVAPLAPGSGIPNGSVIFKADGTAFGPAVMLSNGVASFTSSSLAHGNHLITLEYSGEGNFYPSTNSLGAGQVVDLAPTALLASYPRSFGSALQIPIENLLTNFTTDADGDARTLLWLGSGTNGASVSISGNVISYQPSLTDPNRNTTDCFDYSITDGFIGGMATNKILVTIIGPDPGSQPPVISEISFLTSQVLVRFTGIAGYTYHVERAPLTGNNLAWIDLGSAATDEAGNAQFTDAAPLAGQAFYRVVWKQ
jgi:hypothetical protein